MATTNRITITAALALSAALSGCGGTAYPTAPSNLLPTPFPTFGTGTGTGNDTGGDDDFGDTLPGDLPPITHTFTITGAGTYKTSTMPTALPAVQPTYDTGFIPTDSMLKVRITAGPADRIMIPGGTSSNFAPGYGCVRYSVTVGGRTVQTAVLSPSTGGGALCPGAPSSQVIDFSDRVAGNVVGANIRVSGARYDVYCTNLLAGAIPGCNTSQAMFSSCYNSYCTAGMYPLYVTHTATGTLDILTN